MLERALSDGAWPYMASPETRDDEPLFFLFLVAKSLDKQRNNVERKRIYFEFFVVVKKREIYDEQPIKLPHL